MAKNPEARHTEVLGSVSLLVALPVIVLITRHIRVEAGQRELDALAYGLMAIGVGVLVLRRRNPEVVLAITTATLVTYAIADYPGGPIYIVFCVAVFWVATTRALGPALVLSGTASVILLVAGYLPDPGDKPLWGSLVFLSWSGAAVIAGQARRAHLASNEERERALDEQRREEARLQVIEERLRIARDLHDVVAHSLSSISVQSGAAAHVIERNPAQAKEALLGIQQTSKDALTELRATLDLLRDTSEVAPRAPVARLTDLSPLIDAAARAGLTVDTSVEGAVRALPPAIDTAGYRIVQESLTNTIRHSQADRAQVTLRYQLEGVELEVVDGGPSRTPLGAHGASTGHGLAGMHERAALINGRVEAGPTEDGGFRVCAHLPAAVEPSLAEPVG